MSETGLVSRHAFWMNRLSDKVVRGVIERVRNGALTSGAALPSREALASDFVDRGGDRIMAGHGLRFVGGETGLEPEPLPARRSRDDAGGREFTA